MVPEQARNFKVSSQELALLPALFVSSSLCCSPNAYVILDGMNEAYALLFAVITMQTTYMLSMTTKPLRARLQYPFELEDALYKQRCVFLATMTDVEFEKSKIALAAEQFHMQNIEKNQSKRSLFIHGYIYLFLYNTSVPCICIYVQNGSSS